MKLKSLMGFMVIMVLLVAPCLSGCLYPVSGSGNLVTEQFDYADFDSIVVATIFEVEISQSDTYSISITADDNIMEYVIITKTGDTLQVRLKQGYNYRSVTAIAKISLPDIKGLEMSGATEGILKEFNTSNQIAIDVSGASELEIQDLNAGIVYIDVSGASTVTANLICTVADFDVSGASTATGTIACGDAEFNISGASTMNVTGSGQDLISEVSGASDLKLDNFTVGNVDIEVSGASDAVVNMDGTLNATVSGASSLYYIGSPVMGDIDISGASSVQQKK
jgi:hypothetical protein